MKYLEIDSTYRNRNDWPLVAQFEIPISQTGRKDRYGALDPVSLAAPSVEVWTSNNLNKTGGYILSGFFSQKFNVSPNTVYISVDTNTGNYLQGALNYYRNLSLYFYNTPADIPYYTLKIAGYQYVGRYGNLDIGVLYLLVLPTQFNITDRFKIYDPTSFEDPFNPLIFVPFADLFISPILNGYNNYILYNETLNEYRSMKFFDTLNSLVTIDTTGPETYISGPTLKWKSTNSFSIREKPPIVPNVNSNALIIEDKFTFFSPKKLFDNDNLTDKSLDSIEFRTSESKLILIGVTTVTPENYYKNCSIRIINKIYNYEFSRNRKLKPTLFPPINESIVITHDITYVDNNGKIYLIVTLQRPLRGELITGSDSPMRAEILDFSYDNYNPFVYNGSITSQQNMICYEISLFDLILPTIPLANTGGGNISYYPYVYVEISNISASSAGNRNVMYSNNPHSTFATFRCPIPNVSEAILNTFPFLTIAPSNIQTQLIKFKPNDNLYFTVRMPNGEIFTPIVADNISPYKPITILQVSASFALKRIG